MSVGPIKRLTIWTRDAEAALAFYRDALGLAVIEDKRLAGPAIGALIGRTDAQLRIVHLAAGQAQFGWIGLYELSGPEDRPKKARDSNDLRRPVAGETTIVFTTERFEELVARLRACGTRFLTEPREYLKETPGEATPPGRYRETICFDPDGVMVALMAYEPPTRSA